MLSSDDGGRTWRRDVLDAPLETVAALSCPSVPACYAVGATLGRSGVLPEDALIETTDGGTRWNAGVLPAFPPQPPVGTSGSEILGGGLTSVSCFTATSCIAGGPAGVLATADGALWSVRYQVPGPGNGGVVIDGMLYGQVQQLACPGPSRCVAVFVGPNGESLRPSTRRRPLVDEDRCSSCRDRRAELAADVWVRRPRLPVALGVPRRRR
jgi:hypothetical protein